MDAYYTVKVYNTQGMLVYMACGKNLRSLILGISVAHPGIAIEWTSKVKAPDIEWPIDGNGIGATHTVNFPHNFHLSKIEAFYTITD